MSEEYEDVTVSITVPANIVEKLANADFSTNEYARHEIIANWLSSQVDTEGEIVDEIKNYLGE